MGKLLKSILVFAVITFTQFSVGNADEDFDGTFYGSFMHFPGMPNALFFFDEIKENDSFEMRKALRNHDIDTVVLWSGGGSVFEGLQMAGIIYDRGLTTYVPDGGECLSACSFMFFGGATKIAVGDLGVHQFSVDEEASKETEQIGKTQMVSQFTVSEIIGFLREFDTPPFVYEKMFQQQEMYYFSNDELTKLETRSADFSPKNLENVETFLERLDKFISERTCDDDVTECSPDQLCERASNDQSWSTDPDAALFVKEAKRQGLACNVVEVNATCISNPSACSNDELCNEVTKVQNGVKVWRTDEVIKPYLSETRSRMLYCGVTQQMPSSEKLAIFLQKKGFKVGDALQLTITSSQDCRLTLINIDDDNDSCVLYPSTEFGDKILKGGEPLKFPPRGQLKFAERGKEKIIAVCNYSDNAIRTELRDTNAVSCYVEDTQLAMQSTRESVIMETLILDDDADALTFDDIPNAADVGQSSSGVLKAVVEVEVK